MKNVQKNKSPGNDRLTKKFYECFWNEIVYRFTNRRQKTNVNSVFHKGKQ